MATDGVKIIDGDTAHDTYWGIMDLYDGGATMETIASDFPFPLDDPYDDFEEEIYTTSYALAIWEIGGMTEEILKVVRKVIDKGACIKVWTEEIDEKAGKQRQKELDKLWNKISIPNLKIRKRKKYKLITNFIFNINDVLTFKLPDNNYYATAILDIRKRRGNCSYHFGEIYYKDKIKPTVEKLKEAEIIGRKIPSGLGIDITKIISQGIDEIIKQGGIDEILKREAEKTGSFFIGMDVTAISHNELINFKDKFELIGSIQLKEVCKRCSSYGVALTFEAFAIRFEDIGNDKKVFKAEKFKISELLNE